jgi:vitamin B12 transporter
MAAVAVRIAALIAAVLVTCVTALAQAGAQLTVRLCDERNAVLRGATVELLPTGRVSVADDGRVQFVELPAGNYAVEVSCAGFASRDTTVELQAGESRLIGLVMRRLYQLPVVDVLAEPGRGLTRTFEQTEIAQSSAGTVAEFLNARAGIDVRADGTGGMTGARIGGSNSNQVIVLVDGQRTNRIGDGESDVNVVPLEQVQRIEVTRGSRADVSGEGIGGVILIETRGADGNPQGSASVLAGASDSRVQMQRGMAWRSVGGRLAFSHENGNRDFRYHVIEDDGSGAHAPYLGQQFRRANNDRRRDLLLGRIERRAAESLRWELGAALDMSERGMPGYLAPELTPQARQQNRSTRVNQRTFWDLGAVSAEGRCAVREEVQEFSDPDAPYVKSSSEHSRAAEAEISVRGRLRGVSWQGGVQAGEDWLRSDQLLGSGAERGRAAVWGDVSATSSGRSGIELSPRAGIRAERVGSNRLIGPHAGVAAVLGTWATLDMEWKRSFRAPDFFALFWAEDLVAGGNPDLRAERSAEWVGSLAGTVERLGRLEWSVVGSSQRVVDMIVWRQSFDGRWTPANLAAARVRTLELSIQQSLFGDALKWSGGIDWTEARNQSTERNYAGKYLTFRVPRSWRCGVYGGLWGTRAEVNYRWVDRRAATESNTKWLSAYDLVDASVSYGWQVRQAALGVTVGGKNLLNRDYRIVRFAPMPLQEFHVEISVNELQGKQ